MFIRGANPRSKIELSRKELLRVMGADVPDRDIEEILRALGFHPMRSGCEPRQRGLGLTADVGMRAAFLAARRGARDRPDRGSRAALRLRQISAAPAAREAARAPACRMPMRRIACANA